MPSNPQDAIPLATRADLEQYRTLAKDLVKACQSEDTGAARAWADRWVASLARAIGAAADSALGDRAELAQKIAEFATERLATAGTLARAQYVIARSHGFTSWPKLAAHIDALAHASTETDFEAAADAIIRGDEATLHRLLISNPGLIKARSSREHNATLLHYVSANGVEGYRQVTPKNIVRIAEILLDAGAEVDAEADVYRGKCTALGLVATSAHPHGAGAQNPLMQLLLDRGADVNHADMMGNGHSTILGCLANGCGEAAEYLAERGAVLGLVEAAGVGRLDVVKSFFDESGRPKPGVTKDQLAQALQHAAWWERDDVIEFLRL